MLQPQFVQVVREGRLTVITLDRPEALNALHAPAHHELAAVFDNFAADPEPGLRPYRCGRIGRVRAA